jgi:pimeloyl-ACP methyl ester carboxylesterase
MPGSAADRARGIASTIDVDGVPVHTVEWRARESKPGRRVLLLHGLGSNTLTWEPFGAPLAERLGATVTAVDLIGFGRTRTWGRSAGLATQHRVVHRLLDALGSVLIIGNSMGACIGIGVAAKRPAPVEGLVLINPAVPHPRPGVFDWLRMAWLAPLTVPALGAGVVALRARALGPERLVDMSLQTSVARAELVEPELRRRLVELTTERLRWPDAAPAYADAARSMLAYLARGLHRDMTTIRDSHPMLLLHGAQDKLVPLDAARHTAAVHDVDLHVLDGMGHAPQLEDPNRVVDAVEAWLEERSLPGWSIEREARAS